MKAIIFAAGKGERMRPLTDHTPKPLLTVNGKALIDFHLEKLAKAGFNQVIINLAYKGEMIKHHCGNGSRYGLDIEYSEEGPEPLETGGALNLCLDRFNQKPFAAISSDVFTQLDYAKLSHRVSQLNARQLIADLALIANPSHHPSGDFALDGTLIKIDGAARFTYSGIAILTPKFIHDFPDRRATFPIREPLRYWIAQNQISGWVFTEPWTDVGTPARLADLQLRPM